MLCVRHRAALLCSASGCQREALPCCLFLPPTASIAVVVVAAAVERPLPPSLAAPPTPRCGRRTPPSTPLPRAAAALLVARSGQWLQTAPTFPHGPPALACSPADGVNALNTSRRPPSRWPPALLQSHCDHCSTPRTLSFASLRRRAVDLHAASPHASPRPPPLLAGLGPASARYHHLPARSDLLRSRPLPRQPIRRLLCGRPPLQRACRQHSRSCAAEHITRILETRHRSRLTRMQPRSQPPRCRRW